MKSGMTDRDDSFERRKAERRELEAAGWEPKGRGAKTIWKSPADGRWYAHHQAVEMKRKEGWIVIFQRLMYKWGGVMCLHKTLARGS